MSDDSANIDWWKQMQENAIRVTCPTCDHVEWVVGKPTEISKHIECYSCLRLRMDDSESHEA